jgi:hypothetical protein
MLQNMSTKHFFFLVLFVAASAALFTACESDPCADKDCGNGLCLEDGACDCDAGYEYDSAGACLQVIEHKFVALYTASEDCNLSPAADPYTVTIKHGASETDGDVLLTGLYGKDDTNVNNFFQNDVKAKVDATGLGLTIAKQEPDATSPGFTIEGTGTYNPATNKITFNYMVHYPAPDNVDDVCTSTVLTKQ